MFAEYYLTKRILKMKKHLNLILIVPFMFLLNHISAQSVGINSDGSSPHSSAMLDVKSTDKGLLIPRTDTTTVNAAGTPADGLMIYAPGEKQFYFYTGSRWNAVNGELIDKDGDTKVEVEKFNDEDRIRMSIEGEEAMVVKRSAGGQVVFDVGYNKRNVFLGNFAGSQNGLDSTFVNSGHANTGVGYWALRDNTNGLSNTAVGAYALSDNTTGNSNTSIGDLSMISNTTGYVNTAVGGGSLRSNTSGYNNSAVGLNAMNSNKTGNNSVAFGFRSGVWDTTSVRNVYIGANAGAGGPTTSSKHDKFNNVMVGYGAGENAKGDSNVFLGYQSGKEETGNNRLYIENTDGDSTQALIYGEFDNDIIRLNGKVFMRDGWTDGDCDTKIEVEQNTDEDRIRMSIGGEEAMAVKRSAGGQIVFDLGFNKRNVFLGDLAGSQNGLDSTFVNSGHANTGIGYWALKDNKNGLSNTCIGAYALSANTTGNTNTSIGELSMATNTTGFFNTAVGGSALRSNTVGFSNTAVGLNALNSNKSGNSSASVGYRSGIFDTTSVRNVFFGANAGAGGTTTADYHTKSNNVMIGYGSGENAQGDSNVFLGYESGKDEGGNNKLYIENSDADESSALIYGEFDNNILRVNGNLGVSTSGAPSDKLHIVGTGADNLFRVQLNGSTKMRIYNNSSISLGTNNTGISTGDVYVHNDLGIGVSVPSNKLHVQGNDDGGFMTKIENTNTNSKSSGLIVEVGPSANPGTLNHFIAFQDQNGTIVGSVTGDGSGGVQYNTTSDKRLKQNIQTFDKGIAVLDKIDAHTYEMKSNPGVEHIGFIAQELYEVLPNIVKGTPETTDKESPMMVDYGKITPVLVAAMKELIEKNEALEKEVAGLKQMNSEMAQLKDELASQRGLIENLMTTSNNKKSQPIVTRK